MLRSKKNTKESTNVVFTVVVEAREVVVQEVVVFVVFNVDVMAQVVVLVYLAKAVDLQQDNKRPWSDWYQTSTSVRVTMVVFLVVVSCTEPSTPITSVEVH